MFYWCISKFQPFDPFELTKIFIDYLLNILYLLDLSNATSIYPMLQWWGFNCWHVNFHHIYLKLSKLRNNFAGYFDCLVFLCSRWIFNFAIVNAHQVALIWTFIRLNYEGSATISPFCVVIVCYDTLSINFSWLAIFSNLIARVNLVLEHPS